MHAFEFDVDVEKPFDFELTVKKPAGWHWSTPFEVFEDGTLFTALRLSNLRLVGLKLGVKRGVVKTEAFSDCELNAIEKKELFERVKLGLGVGDDLKGFYSLAKRDALIKRLKKDLYGMRLGSPNDVFERALLAICLQMAPMKRSNQMMQCLIRCYGDAIRFYGKEIFYWPSPTKVAGTTTSDLREKCNLGYRAKSIREIAEAIIRGFPNILELRRLSEEQALKQLKSLYGIGDYSAQIISPHSGFPLDVWSARIFHEIIFGTTPKEPRKVIKRVEEEAKRRWGRYRWHVFVYVLHDLPRLLKHYKITKPT
jgi:3-methyladenine DNA glycosylase/8-oxoguanine DNA glycosylase